ncbi:MAG: 2-dehydropantoate 2-reductase [Proteobacteria bacterium]|nr:2-dehydropantoate 2-reductase [Pseudomonadota bacterium]MBU1708935.1 2-dehydropantoate 2-reductase [Pseudomonadota bacterium]
MKIVVIGPGALGCLLASSLAAGTDHAIWLLDHDPKRALLLSRQGIFLERGGTETKKSIPVTHDASTIGIADFVFLCVKSHHTESALVSMSQLLSRESLLLAFQNGINHLDILQQKMSSPWVAGVTSMGATLVDQGRVRFGGTGITSLGFLSPANDQEAAKLAHAAELLNSAGFETVITNDILSKIWNKFLINIGINALTAIHNCPNGRLLETPSIKNQLRAAVKEALHVAKAKGITISENPVSLTETVCRATSQNISSMLQDIRNQRQTEIEAINGALIREARLLGLETPVNEELADEVRNLQMKYLN